MLFGDISRSPSKVLGAVTDATVLPELQLCSFCVVHFQQWVRAKDISESMFKLFGTLVHLRAVKFEGIKYYFDIRTKINKMKNV